MKAEKDKQLNGNTIRIQQHLIKPTFKEKFFMKVGENKTIKISKDKYIELYDKSWGNANIVVLPPITKELF